MVNRFQVIETLIDGDSVHVQALNSHVNFTSIYWYYPQKGVTAFNILRIIDCKLQIVYDWIGCQNMMFLENLMRAKHNKENPHNPLRIEQYIIDAMIASGYLDSNREITNKGYEHIHQYERPTTHITLNKINSTTQLFKAGK